MNTRSYKGVSFKEATPALEHVLRMNFNSLIEEALLTPNQSLRYQNSAGQIATAVSHERSLFIVLFHNNGLELGTYIDLEIN